MALNRITYTWGEEEMEGQQIKIKSHEDAAFSTRPMGKEASQQTLAAPGAGLAEVGCRCLLPLACCGGTGPTFPTRPLESPTPQESGPPSGEHSPVLALGPVLSAAPAGLVQPDGRESQREVGCSCLAKPLGFFIFYPTNPNVPPQVNKQKQ